MNVILSVVECVAIVEFFPFVWQAKHDKSGMSFKITC